MPRESDKSAAQEIQSLLNKVGKDSRTLFIQSHNLQVDANLPFSKLKFLFFESGKNINCKILMYPKRIGIKGRLLKTLSRKKGEACFIRSFSINPEGEIQKHTFRDFYALVSEDQIIQRVPDDSLLLSSKEKQISMLKETATLFEINSQSAKADLLEKLGQ